MKSLSAKVLVIGGGPAGSIAARTLAETGIDTLLIEKNLSYVKPCGGGIPSTAFDELRIPKNLIKKQVENIRVISPKGRVAEFPLKGGFVAIVERGEFDRGLRDEAKRAGAEVIEARFVKFISTDKNTVLTEAVIGNEQVRIVSDYVIASDGAGSKAVALLKGRAQESVFTLSAKIKNQDCSACEFWLGDHAPGFYSWVFPSSEGISAGTGGLRPEQLAKNLKTFLKRRALQEADSLHGYKIPIWNGRLFRAGRVLFAGDSAGQVMPFTFEGIYYAMKSGSFAAQAIAERRIDNYKKLWQERFRQRFIFMKGLWRTVLRNSILMEKFVAMHQEASVQEIASRLWLDKSSQKRSLIDYIKLLTKMFG